MSAPVELALAALRARGHSPRPSGGGWSCTCPAHDDRRPSLSVREGRDGRLLLRCHRGCTYQQILDALGLTPAEVRPAGLVTRAGAVVAGKTTKSVPPKGARPKAFASAESAIKASERALGSHAGAWPYHDARGEVVGYAVRWDLEDGKTYRPVARTERGWELTGMPEPRPLYGLPALEGEAVVVVTEGEKCADAARSLGFIASTSAHGAESPEQTDWTPLSGVEVWIIPDHDTPGGKFAAAVADLLVSLDPPAEVKIVRLPGLQEREDLVEFIAARTAAGLTLDQIRREIEALAQRAAVVGAAPPAEVLLYSAKSLRELLADHPQLRPPVIEGLLRQGETMNVIAPPKMGKSWLVHGLAICIATGRPWLGTFPTVRGDVLLLDNELHPETIARRVPRVAEAMGASLAEIADAVRVQCLRGNLRDIETLEPYFDAIEPGRFQVIVIDAFYRVLPPDTDENDNGAMAQLYNRLDRYAARLGCAFVLIHHAAKGNQSAKSVTDVGAGAGAQSRATDAHLVLRPHEEEGVVVLDAAVRSWPPIDPVCLRWDFPVFRPEVGLDPTRLRKDRPRRDNPKEPAPAKPTPPKFTPEQFAARFVTREPAIPEQIFATAREVGLTKPAAQTLLMLAVEGGHAFRWQLSHSDRVRYASVPRPLTATAQAPNRHMGVRGGVSSGGGKGGVCPPPHPPVAAEAARGRGEGEGGPGGGDKNESVATGPTTSLGGGHP